MVLLSITTPCSSPPFLRLYKRVTPAAIPEVLHALARRPVAPRPLPHHRAEHLGVRLPEVDPGDQDVVVVIADDPVRPDATDEEIPATSVDEQVVPALAEQHVVP